MGGFGPEPLGQNLGAGLENRSIFSNPGIILDFTVRLFFREKNFEDDIFGKSGEWVRNVYIILDKSGELECYL